MEIRSPTVSVSPEMAHDCSYLTFPLPDIESKSGSLYCQICDDIVWDPTLEELRVRKIGTGSFSGRHHSEM